MDRNADLIERDFAGQIERYRSRTLRTWSILIVLSVCAVVAGSWHLPQVVRYAIGAGLAVGGIGLALLQFRSGLRCPSCSQALDLSIADFCPDCGTSVAHVSGGERRDCPSCSAHWTVDRVNGRRWTIRVCTFCGVRLTEPGI